MPDPAICPAPSAPPVPARIRSHAAQPPAPTIRPGAGHGLAGFILRAATRPGASPATHTAAARLRAWQSPAMPGAPA